MSTWESEMTPKEWEDVMGVPYSHISMEEGEANRKFNMDKVKEVLDQIKINWEAASTEWCSCPHGTNGYDSHIPPNISCPICKASIDNDHYHCGVCSKISQVG